MSGTEGTGEAVTCTECGQRVGVLNGKVAEHQSSGPGSGRCSGSGKDVD